MRIIFFIVSAPKELKELCIGRASRACLGIITAGLRHHRWARQVPPINQALWRQSLGRRPLAQILKTANLTRPKAGCTSATSSLSTQVEQRHVRDPAASRLTFAIATGERKLDRNATDSGSLAAVTADHVSAHLVIGSRFGADSIPRDY
jgi:hypothetical protein